MDADLEAHLRRLVDEDAIRAVVHRRARATDQRDLELALSCYHPDGTEDHEGFDGPVREYLRTASPVFVGESPIEVGFHLIGNVEITLDGDQAHCESYFLCALTSAEPSGRRDYLNAGRYLDEFERRDGFWAIRHRACAYEWSHGSECTDRWWTRDSVAGR